MNATLGNLNDRTLAPDVLQKMDAYWRASNYLSVGQIYLYDNPLLKRPLALSDVKHMLLGQWNEAKGVLNITRANGQEYPVRNSAITAGSHKVFGVETVGKEVHVLTGPRGNPRPSRRVRFNDSGGYKGSTGL